MFTVNSFENCIGFIASTAWKAWYKNLKAVVGERPSLALIAVASKSAVSLPTIDSMKKLKEVVVATV